jgi:exodeoxyribonuclease VII small subunit
VAKSHAHSSPERYEDIVRRLDEVVRLLESSEVPCKSCQGIGQLEGEPCPGCQGKGKEPLPLEESLKAFEEGVSLVRRGEAKLNEAEKRVELLLNEAGDKRVAFDADKPRSEAPPNVQTGVDPTAPSDRRPGKKAIADGGSDPL